MVRVSLKRAAHGLIEWRQARENVEKRLVERLAASASANSGNLSPSAQTRAIQSLALKGITDNDQELIRLCFSLIDPKGQPAAWPVDRILSTLQLFAPPEIDPVSAPKQPERSSSQSYFIQPLILSSAAIIGGVLTPPLPLAGSALLVFLSAMMIKFWPRLRRSTPIFGLIFPEEPQPEKLKIDHRAISSRECEKILDLLYWICLSHLLSQESTDQTAPAISGSIDALFLPVLESIWLLKREMHKHKVDDPDGHQSNMLYLIENILQRLDDAGIEFLEVAHGTPYTSAHQESFKSHNPLKFGDLVALHRPAFIWNGKVIEKGILTTSKKA